LKRAGEAPGELAGRLSGPFQARTEAHLPLCGARRLAQWSIGGSAQTLLAGLQPPIEVVEGNNLLWMRAAAPDPRACQRDDLLLTRILSAQTCAADLQVPLRQ
jgi:hypothetical protein